MLSEESTEHFAAMQFYVDNRKRCDDPAYVLRYSTVSIYHDEKRIVETVRRIRPDSERNYGFLLRGLLYNEVYDFELKIICGVNFDRYTRTIHPGFGGGSRSPEGGFHSLCIVSYCESPQACPLMCNVPATTVFSFGFLSTVPWGDVNVIFTPSKLSLKLVIFFDDRFNRAPPTSFVITCCEVEGTMPCITHDIIRTGIRTVGFQMLQMTVPLDRRETITVNMTMQVLLSFLVILYRLFRSGIEETCIHLVNLFININTNCI